VSAGGGSASASACARAPRLRASRELLGVAGGAPAPLAGREGLAPHEVAARLESVVRRLRRGADRRAPGLLQLDAQNGANWVGAPQLGVPPAPVASVAKVGTRAALILVTPGRVIPVWNSDGDGTFVSIRLAGRSRAGVTEAALAVAGSWS
jgi:hypothetical protein